ncbi:MAG: TIGR02186 family protein [Pseudomonadota bacterium]
MRRCVILLALMMAQAGWAEEIVLGLSRDEVSITTSFDGSDILIFGAIKRETPIIQDPPLQVLITVAGPSEPVLVRRKARRAGIWINTDAVEIDSAPSFYAVATTGPLEDVLSATEDLRHDISLEKAIRSVGAPQNISDASMFTDALIRIRSEDGLYQLLEGGVALDQQTLFRSSISMPANLTDGDYLAEIYLTRGGRVITEYETVIDVRKVGLERWIFDLSRAQPLVYGILSLIVAVAAGWGASTIFTLLRRR